MAAKNNIPTRPVGQFKLGISLWFVTHRIVLKRLLVVSLAVIDVGLYGYTFAVVIGLARGQEAYRTMVASLSQDFADYRLLRPLIAAKPLQLSAPLVLSSSGSLVDLAVLVVNPNQKFAVPSLSYRFLDGGNAVGSGSSFLLPGESKYLFSFGIRQPAGTVRFELFGVHWQRIKPDQFARLKADRLQVVVSNVRHLRGDELGTLSQLLGGQTSFNVTNQSIYGYWDVGLHVLLFNGEQLVAASFTRARRLNPQQRQTVSISWPQLLPLYTKIEIVPEINLFTQGSFYEYHAPGAEPR